MTRYKTEDRSSSSRKSLRRQLLKDSGALYSVTFWMQWDTRDNNESRSEVRCPLGGRRPMPGVTYQTGPRFGQQLADARKAVRS